MFERKKKHIILMICTNDAFKISLYVVLMTILFILYYNNGSERIETSSNYNYLFDNKAIISLSENGNENV